MRSMANRLRYVSFTDVYDDGRRGHPGVHQRLTTMPATLATKVAALDAHRNRVVRLLALVIVYGPTAPLAAGEIRLPEGPLAWSALRPRNTSGINQA